jgi:hypothetical protein
MMRAVFALLLLCTICVSLAACAPGSGGGAGSGEAGLRNDLKVIGLVYHNYHDEHRQGPPGWDEMIAYAESTNMDGNSIRRVRDAGYDVRWNLKFSEATDGMSNTVLAQRPAGGPKLMLDGSVPQ